MQNAYGEPVTLTALVLVVLASARIIRLIAFDRVPFGKAREDLESMAWDKETGVIPQQPYELLFDLLTCGWCLGIYVGILSSIWLWGVHIQLTMWVALPFAIAQASSTLVEWGRPRG
jgi:hypothetical protein